MSSEIEKIIEQKESSLPLNWQERFLNIYKMSRELRIKLTKVLFVFIFLWGLVFYTPFVWFLAKPLKFSQELKKTDAIVVFAGGVGETGRAGQGYEERVKYSVELYKENFAYKLIFSSGARSTFPEPYIMKALAISLGVPDKDIILDDRASNTYENVKFTEAILNKNKFNSIILVSSPYHMRRASLVFKKIAPEKDVVYSPVPDSKFYKNEELTADGKSLFMKINIEQIKAILHEFLAIVYYKYKGYI